LRVQNVGLMVEGSGLRVQKNLGCGVQVMRRGAPSVIGSVSAIPCESESERAGERQNEG
jgi:hypothetical protein